MTFPDSLVAPLRKRLARLGLPAGLGVLALFGTSWAGENRIDAVRPDAPELAAYGKSPIGVRTLRLVNPGQMDILKAKAGEPTPLYDRPLTVEVWYPSQPHPAQPEKSADGLEPGQYRTLTRDPKLTVVIQGKALRDAVPAAQGGPYPLVIISHGYPGNRYLLSPLAENLASKGYVVASIDHTDSTYGDQAAFASTLLNRPLDQLFVLETMSRLNTGDPADAAGGSLKGMVQAANTALIGYSMGGYGVVNAIGGGFTAASTRLAVAPPNGVLARRQAGSAELTASVDPRVKAAVAFAPWGWNAGFWDAAGLAGIRTPILFIAGSVDDVSGYAPGVRNLFEASVNAPRYMLTYENANHNAGAPMPAPAQTWAAVPHMPNPAAFHYMDPVWDSVRMNNIAQHFVTAFLGRHLRNDASMEAYLKLVEHARDGRWSAEPNGAFKADHTHWKGFQRRQASGLRLEFRPAAP
ncbi:MAG: alpha/beta hydrolase family protein [Rubrivivax sp.]